MTATDPSAEPDPIRSPVRELVGVIGLGLGLLAALVVAFTWQSSGAGPALSVAKPVELPSPSGPYAGPRSCRECHPGESALSGRSGHARTLRPAASSPVARRLDGRSVADPEWPGVTWSYALRDGAFHASRAEGDREVERLVLDFVFGSGDHAATFLTVTDPSTPTSLEHRLTYLAATDSFCVTPGQREANPKQGLTTLGKELSPLVTLKCFGCHTTPTSGLRPTAEGRAPVADLGPLTPNVSCERCHGPSRSHVEAARQGRAGPSVPFGFDNWTAESVLGLCGQCHRHPSRFPAESIRRGDPALARFQPIGLMQSKCYTRSGGSFSCVTCHDPHARASKDPASYESACLTCHGPPRPASPTATTCPVSPRGGCLDCHMPKVESGQRILFTDHWIRVRESGE